MLHVKSIFKKSLLCHARQKAQSRYGESRRKKTTLLPLWRCYSLQIEGKVKNGSPDFLKLIADVFAP